MAFLGNLLGAVGASLLEPVFNAFGGSTKPYTPTPPSQPNAPVPTTDTTLAIQKQLSEAENTTELTKLQAQYALQAQASQAQALIQKANTTAQLHQVEAQKAKAETLSVQQKKDAEIASLQQKADINQYIPYLAVAAIALVLLK